MKRCLIVLLALCALTVAKAQVYGVKTNALGWATGTLNAGVEMSVTKQWSIELSGYWNPIAKSWWVQPAVRYWLREHFAGHFFSAHPAYGWYNIDNRKGLFSGLGVSYGYTWPLSGRWSFTAEGGLGVFYMRDTKRLSETPECVTRSSRIVLAPSKVEVAFGYLF